ncbi:MAG: ribose-phosphate pyrophosphokinase [Deltaproteobacteria bacterium]|nr:ribose-phosphate pyrophosphokinase [Deltaproteobacteria bacterium]
MTKKPLVFTSTNYEHMRSGLEGKPGIDLGNVVRKTFSDKERHYQVMDDVADRPVVLIGGTGSNDDLVDVLDMGFGISELRPSSLTIIVPYYGYSTQERAEKDGEFVTGRHRARMLSNISSRAHRTSVVLVDPHTPGLVSYFDQDHVSTYHLSCRKLLTQSIRESVEGRFSIGTTDLGRAKEAGKVADELGAPLAIIHKSRHDIDKTKVLSVISDEPTNTVVVWDDMIRTGGSLKEAMKAYEARGYKHRLAYAVHGVFPGESLKAMMDSRLFDGVVVTDSHPRAVQLAKEFPDFLRVIPMVPIIADYIVDRVR